MSKQTAQDKTKEIEKLNYCKMVFQMQINSNFRVFET